MNHYPSGDVTIQNCMTFTVDPDLKEGSPQFTLTCISTGGPATNVTWTRNNETVSRGMTVLDDTVTAMTVLDDKEAATYTHTLTVTGKLGGQYKCTVSNNKPSENSESFTVRGKENVKREQKKENVYTTF